MLTYLYLDYGGLPNRRQELKYSLISLRQELRSDAGVAVYSDAPEAYRNWPVTAVGMAGRLAAWSGGGLYHRRVKPEVVKDALARFAGPVCFLAADSIVRPAFHAEVTARIESAVVLHAFARTNPYPPLSGFRCRLPHLGDYRYDARGSLMYDSGLIGMRPEHAPLLDDVLAMIDALIGRAKKFPAIEQFALSEVLRLNQIPVAEVRNSFLHYWQGRRRIYTENQIARSLLPDWNDLTLPKQWTEMNGWAVRAYNYYYGTTHALEFLR
jgi:hypothetical protein